MEGGIPKPKREGQAQIAPRAPVVSSGIQLRHPILFDRLVRAGGSPRLTAAWAAWALKDAGAEILLFPLSRHV